MTDSPPETFRLSPRRPQFQMRARKARPAARQANERVDRWPKAPLQARSGSPWQPLGSSLSFVPLNGEAKDVQDRTGVRVGLADVPAGPGGRDGRRTPALLSVQVRS